MNDDQDWREDDRREHERKLNEWGNARWWLSMWSLLGRLVVVPSVRGGALGYAPRPSSFMLTQRIREHTERARARIRRLTQNETP